MDSGSIQTRTSDFLFNYRITFQGTTEELLMKRKLHSQLIPDISSQVAKAQEQQKTCHDSKMSRDRQFAVDDSVMVCSYFQGDPWVQAHIIEQSGPVSYKVSVDSTKA